MVATSEISTQVVLIKAKMGSEFRRFRMAAYNADMDRLTTILRHHFEIDPVDELKISYEDSDGDFIRMSTDYDFVEACHHALPKEQGEWEMIVTVETCGPDDFQRTAKMIALMLGLAKECETNPSRSNCQALRSIARTLEATAQRIGKIPTGNVEFGDFQMAESVPPESSNYETVHGVPFNVFREIERGEEEEDLLQQVLGQAHSDDSNRNVPMHAEEGDDEDEDDDDDEVDLGCVDGHSLLEFHRHLLTIRRKSFDSILPLVDDDADSETPETERRQSIFWGPPAISGPSLTFPARFNRSKIFTVPFPATFSFPPSPTPTEPVFTLSEDTPFPFSPSIPEKKTVATASASTCTARKITRTAGICASVRTTETCVQTAEEKKSVTEASTQTKAYEPKVRMPDVAGIKVPSIVIENTASKVITEVAVCVPVVEEPKEFPIDEDEEELEDDEDEEELEGDEELENDSSDVEQLPSGVEVPLSPISPESVSSDLDDLLGVRVNTNL